MSGATLGKFLTTVFTIIALTAAPQLFAQQEDQAKEYFLKGKALVEEGAYKKAIIELKASYEIKAVPIVAYNIGLCFDKLQQYADAIKFYRQFALQAEEAALKEKVTQRIKELEKFIGTIVLEVNEEGAEIIVDDKLVGQSPLEKILMETGEHDLLVRKTGFFDIKKKFAIASGKTIKFSLSLKKR